MKMITVFIPESYIETLDLLVIEERFPSRSEAIRSAIRDLIRNEVQLREALHKRREKININNNNNERFIVE